MRRRREKRRQCEDRGRDWRDVAISHVSQVRPPPEAGRGKKGFPAQSLQGKCSLAHILIMGFSLAFRAVRE